MISMLHPEHLIDRGRPLQAVCVEGGWLEVDTARDLELYRRMLDEGSLDRFCRLSAPRASSS